MSRFIDAEIMPKDEFFEGLSDIEKAKVIQWMISAPTADVVEVRHGEWLHPLYDKPWEPGTFCRCSYCGYCNNGHTKKTPNYCEDCGAIMDDERREDNE